MYYRELYKISIAFCLVICICLTSGCDASNPNGEKAEGGSDKVSLEKKENLTYLVDDDSLEYTLLDSNMADFSNNHLTEDKDIHSDGYEKSFRWDRLHENTYFEMHVEDNLRKYHAIKLKVYSQVATNSEILLSVNCQPSKGFKDKTAYFYKSFLVDWIGWREIILELDKFNSNYYPDLSKATSVDLSSTPFGSIPDPSTVLWFEYIGFIGDDYNFNLTDSEIIPDIFTVLDKVEYCLIGSKRNAKEWEAGLLEQTRKYHDTGIPFDADMVRIGDLTSNYDKVLMMAKLYAYNGYKDAELKQHIIRSLDYLHDNYYSDRTLHEFKQDSWYAWQISIPTFICNTLTLMRNDLSQEQIDNYLEPVLLNSFYPTESMANRIEIGYTCIVSAALQGDFQRLIISRDMLEECFGQVNEGNGFYKDGSFIQHSVIPYTGDYGLVMLDGLSQIIYILNDTCFQFDEKHIDIQIDWFKNAFVPFIYHGAVASSVRGRAIDIDGWTDISQGLTAVQGLLRMTEYVDVKDKIYLQEVIGDYCVDNESYYKGKLDPFCLELLDNIKSCQKDVKIVKAFPSMDRAVYANNSFYTNIAMSSSRIAKYEAMSDVNTDGWYTGEGMVYVYLSSSDYDERYWKNVNKYRLPGTTVSTQFRDRENIDPLVTLTDCDFVGSIASDNCVLAAMNFKNSTDEMSFYSDLSGNKAWFILDGKIVCAGNSISCSDGNSIETVIENRLLQNDEVSNISLVEHVGDSSNGYLYIPNYGGVIFPKKSNIRYDITKNSFLEAYIDHKINPDNETYEYTLYPNASEDETENECKSPSIEILNNDNNCTVFKSRDSKITAYVFWNKGEYEGVRVSEPCIIIRDKDSILIGDPTQKLESVDVTVNGTLFKIDEFDEFFSSRVKGV